MTAPPPVRARQSALWRLTLAESKLFLRERVGPIWGIALPLLLLVIFGSIPFFKKPQASFGGYTTLDIYVPILIAMMLGLLSLVALPMVLAGYRERGILRRLQTTPAGPARVLSAQLLINLGAAAVTVIVLLTVARLAYSVPLPRQLAGFTVAVLLAAAALMSFGLLVAAVAPTGRTAQVIGSLLFYPLMFFSGLWLPIPSMPVTLQHISHATPLGAAWEAMAAAATGSWPHALPVLTMAGYAVVFGTAAARLFRWE
ncbi:MAG: ABC transporter permease [Streptosporangiaceae bacterium]